MIAGRTNKVTRKLLVFALAFTMALSSVVAVPISPMATVAAASQSVITDGEGTLTGTLSTDETYKVEVEDCCLQATVGTATYKFRSYLNIVGVATVAADDLLHILTLSGKYYVVDLRYGSFVTIEVWRNTDTAKYDVKSASSYEVFGSTIVDQKYFYERVTTNSVSRERLVTRSEFEAITNPGGNVDPEPSTEQPTPVVTKYTVGFNTNGGSYVASQTVEAGSKVTRPNDPTKSGYTFAGWFADSTLTSEFDFNSAINADTTIYAKWTENSNPTPVITTKYTVDFNTNGGSYIASQTVEEGSKATRPSDPTKSGYTFAGWFADSALTSAFDFNNTINADTTIYAKWTENSNPTPVITTKYTVDFNTNGGSYIASQTVEEGSKATRPSDPIKSGYNFSGWFANSELTSAYDFSSAVNANMTVYAKWTEIEWPSTEAPSTEAPSTQAPSTEAPTTEQPKTEAPTTEQPSTQQPSTQAPSTGDWPTVVWPSLDDITTQQPTTEQPKTEKTTEVASTEQPTVEKTTGEFDIDWWYAKYIAGDITWDQLMQVLYKYQWNAAKEETSKEITYYFYDDNGNLIRTEKIGKTVEQSAGVGEASGTVSTTGEADVKVVEKEAGTATVKVELETTTTGGGNDSAAAAAAAEVAKAAAEAAKAVSNVAVNNTTNTTTTKTKKKYHVVRKDILDKNDKVVAQRVKLQYDTKGICSVYFNSKKHYAKFDGIKYKNIKYVGYTQGSRMIIMITRSNKVYIVPRAKGQIGKVYTKRVLKGKWKLAVEDGAGLVTRVSDKKSKVKGVINATPKKITKKKK